LVVYIPPPPDESAGTPKTPEAIYNNAYPPKPRRSTTPPKRRFAFLRFKSKKGKGDNKNADGAKSDKRQDKGEGEPQTWEEHWEQGEYPFVRLEGNRAACAICLMDFEEPKRMTEPPGDESVQSTKTEKPIAHDQSVAEGPVQEILIDRIQEEDREAGPKLEDAGEGPQPLRLLSCGHVFHKTCLDPWLVDVSGRCPVCQRPVELPTATRRKKRGRGQNQ